MDKLPFYRNYYEQPEIRNEDVGLEERVTITLKMVPKEIYSYLDIGCRDGTILNKLGSDLFKVAVDISYNILTSLKTKNKILSRSDALPFRSNYCDLIVCTEVLEHLKEKEFNLTISEMGNRANSRKLYYNLSPLSGRFGKQIIVLFKLQQYFLYPYAYGKL